MYFQKKTFTNTFYMSQYVIKDREFCLYKHLSLLHIHSFQIESLAQMFVFLWILRNF